MTLSDELNLFSPIRPQLAGKKKMKYFSSTQAKEYFVENKYDGERIQAHIDKTLNKVKLFSRNAIDYTHIYEEIAEMLKDHVQVDSCILDGEVVVLEKNSL